jgi:hypothetical protein
MNLIEFTENNYNDVLNELHDYMLDNNTIDKYLVRFNENNKKPNQQSKNITNKNNKVNSDFFFPKDNDTLFWCFYIIQNSMLDYEMTNNKNIIFEKNIKIKYVEKIRKEKKTIKNYKLASLTNIENNLVNDDKINELTFLSLCIIEKINVIIIKKNTYFELITNFDTNNVYLINFSNHKFGFKLIEKTNYDNYIQNMFKIENIQKPIKSLTYYKVDELVDICNKLGIEITNLNNGKQKTKKELYELIIQYL